MFPLSFTQVPKVKVGEYVWLHVGVRLDTPSFPSHRPHHRFELRKAAAAAAAGQQGQS